jgi:hypothetical protein
MEMLYLLPLFFVKKLNGMHGFYGEAQTERQNELFLTVQIKGLDELLKVKEREIQLPHQAYVCYMEMSYLLPLFFVKKLDGMHGFYVEA